MTMHDLSGMAVFARVVEARSFSAAARALGLSKSAVSKEIARLEDHLGVRLLNRTTRRLALTEAGALFYERSARVVREAAEAERAVQDLGTEPRGLLRINAPMSFGHLHLAPAVADFLGRQPAVRIEMTLEDRVIDVVGEGFDIVIRIADLPPSSLVARRIAINRRIVCAAPAYLAAHGTPELPQDLTRHNCLNYAYLASGDVWRFRGTAGPVAVRVSGSFSANNGDVLRHAAVAGLGVILMPTFLIGPELQSGALVPILNDYRESDTGIYALYPPTRHVSPKVRAFIDFLVERFGPEPYWDAACPRGT
jgi:DNA-binding transcriptional LysR family regulator